MIRARFYLSDNDSWRNITEGGIYSTAWINGMGLRGSFTYTYEGNSVTINQTNVSGISVAALKSLLNSHPEGVEIYSRNSTMHAVLVTDYEGDTFYCSDSDPGRTSDRIPLTSSLLGNYGSQANILSNIGAYWIITGYSIAPTPRKPTNAWINVSSREVLKNDPITITFGANNADTYFLTIKKNGVTYVSSQSYSGVTYYLDEGDYTAFVTCANGYGTTDSQTISFSVVSPVDMGADFYGIIRHESLDKALGFNGILNFYQSLRAVSQTNSNYNCTIFHFERVENNYYKISLATPDYTSDVKYLCNDDGSIRLGTYDGLPVDKWFFTRKGNGYYIHSDENHDLVLNASHSGDDNIIRIVQFSEPHAEEYLFTVNKINQNTSQINYSISATRTQITSYDQNTTIKIQGSVPYAFSYKYHMILPDATERIYESSGPECTFSSSTFVADGTYTIFAEVSNPYYSEKGSAENKCVKIDVHRWTAEGDFEYTVLDDGTVSINSYTGSDKNVVIPSVLGGKKVSEVSGSFRKSRNKDNIESITVSDGIERIQMAAFSGLKNLRKAILPDSIATYMDSTFYDCENLVEVKLSENTTQLTANVFSNCKSLKHITIPSSVKRIEYYNFENCISLEYIVIPQSVEFLYNYNFNGVPKSMIIYGVPGSYAEEYANKNGFVFKDIKELPDPDEEKPLLGDADSDGEVTIFDATSIQRYLAELPATGFHADAADADGDGEVSIFDATAIQRYLAELATNPNIGKPIA